MRMHVQGVCSAGDASTLCACSACRVYAYGPLPLPLPRLPVQGGSAARLGCHEHLLELLAPRLRRRRRRRRRRQLLLQLAPLRGALLEPLPRLGRLLLLLGQLLLVLVVLARQHGQRRLGLP